MEGPGLECGDAFAHERQTAVDQACFLGAILERLARDGVIILLVGLTEIGGVREGQRALLLHPMQGGGGVEPAREGDADLLVQRQGF